MKSKNAFFVFLKTELQLITLFCLLLLATCFCLFAQFEQPTELDTNSYVVTNDMLRITRYLTAVNQY